MPTTRNTSARTTTGTSSSLSRTVGLRSATALVVANIIGAGIFTTTGFQAADLGHPGWIFALWVIGGALALTGAMAYSELGTAMPHAGGEYVYLRETYGPIFGFMSAVVSLVAGFSAAIAAASKSLVRYLAYFAPALTDPGSLFGIHLEDVAAIGFVWILVAIHLRGSQGSFGFNDLVTVLKVIGIVTVIVAAFLFGDGSPANLTYVSDRYSELSTLQRFTALGTSLIFVSFCYTGWNAASYLAGELREPARDLPRALVLGTGLVVALYLGLNAMYLYGANVDQLNGVVEVGLVSGQNLFGRTGVSFVTLVLALSIFASMSAMTIAGPRVYWAFGHDYPLLRRLSTVNPKTRAPVSALLLQGFVTSLLVVSGRVDQIQQFAGFTLSLFSTLAVSCVFVLRRRRPELERPIRTWGYPYTPLFFIALSVWTMVWAFLGRPLESTLALITVVAAGGLFALLERRR